MDVDIDSHDDHVSTFPYPHHEIRRSSSTSPHNIPLPDSDGTASPPSSHYAASASADPDIPPDILNAFEEAFQWNDQETQLLEWECSGFQDMIVTGEVRLFSISFLES